MSFYSKSLDRSQYKVNFLTLGFIAKLHTSANNLLEFVIIYIEVQKFCILRLNLNEAFLYFTFRIESSQRMHLTLSSILISVADASSIAD